MMKCIYRRACGWLKRMLFAATLLVALPAHALDPINTTYFGNLAIEGYDPVAYFIENQPVEGKKDFEYEWMDAKWRFSSAENLTLFKDNPEQYAPAYGGYCAYAVSQNTTASIEPEQFTIHEGKLYLNYNKEVNTMWLANRDDYIAKADRHWPALLNK